MNTMAERDLGSTVLLPHTHLYKPSTDRVNIEIKLLSISKILTQVSICILREVTFQDLIHFRNQQK